MRSPVAPPPVEAFLRVPVKTNIAAHTWQNTFWRRPDLFTSISILVPVPPQATTEQQWSTIVSPLSHVFTDVYITTPVFSKPHAKDGVLFSHILSPAPNCSFVLLFVEQNLNKDCEQQRKKAGVSFRVTCSLPIHREETCKRGTSWPIPARRGEAHLFVLFSKPMS